MEHYMEQSPKITEQSHFLCSFGMIVYGRTRTRTFGHAVCLSIGNSQRATALLQMTVPKQSLEGFGF